MNIKLNINELYLGSDLFMYHSRKPAYHYRWEMLNYIFFPIILLAPLPNFPRWWSAITWCVIHTGKHDGSWGFHISTSKVQICCWRTVEFILEKEIPRLHPKNKCVSIVNITVALLNKSVSNKENEDILSDQQSCSYYDKQ